jgi:hypothetical protein
MNQADILETYIPQQFELTSGATIRISVIRAIRYACGEFVDI